MGAIGDLLETYVVVQLSKEASLTRGGCVATTATLRAVRPDPSLRKSGLLGMTSKLQHHRNLGHLSRSGRDQPDWSVGSTYRRKTDCRRALSNNRARAVRSDNIVWRI